MLDKEACKSYVVPIRDTLNVLSGKWKLPIIGALYFGARRFKELEREIPQITPRMLSKELKELELNELVRRTVYNTTPVSVEYELTESGRSLEKVLNAMKDWGLDHRARVTGKDPRKKEEMAGI
ncbi:MAG: helix-turn-helix transcriptional regulator [Bacteroidia bacterium]|nr:helix-turn-helix transcriptional regulator [Bacteroidia bacterium]